MKELLLSLTIAGIVAGSAAAGTALANPFTTPQTPTATARV